MFTIVRRKRKSDVFSYDLKVTVNGSTFGSILSEMRPMLHMDSFFCKGDHIGLQPSRDEITECRGFYLSRYDSYLSNPYYHPIEEFLESAREKEGEQMSDYFKVSKVTPLNELNEGDKIGRSDLAVQLEDKLIQFDFVTDDTKKKKTIIKPGTWCLTSSNSGVKLDDIVLAKKRLLLDVTNTSAILSEADCFFSNLDVYRELERPLKRGILLYSQPGLGKTASIAHFCEETRKNDPGTVVIVWPTAKIESYQVEQFLSSDSEYDKSVTKVILVLEDVGGGEVECGRRAVDSSLLNLLDGVTVTFSLPTFIIATTNHPENLLKSLADRPGRFDLMMELKPPSAEERVKLTAFIAKRDLTEEEVKAIASKDADGLSISHLDEIVVRSRLHSKSIMQTLEEILKHRKFMNKGFSRDERTMGLGVDDDE